MSSTLNILRTIGSEKKVSADNDIFASEELDNEPIPSPQLSLDVLLNCLSQKKEDHQPK